jgi:hypothetical protein
MAEQRTDWWNIADRRERAACRAVLLAEDEGSASMALRVFGTGHTDEDDREIFWALHTLARAEREHLEAQKEAA